jgi:beta-glucosidase/6-phospho-beta-glucosidase/beta-galactosidase
VTDTSWHTDGRLHHGVGIEDTFIPSERVGQRKLDEYELTQHYHLWREDLRLAAESGATLIRWGSPWYLVEPEEGRVDFRWLDEVMAEMQRLGLHCVLDVMHYGTPLWLANAFLDPRYPELVARYAAAVAQRYPGVVDDVTPLNEPMVNAVWCGRDGRWPPYLTGEDGLVAVLIPLARGMVATQRAVAAVRPDARFVHVDAGFLWEGHGPAGMSVAEGEAWRFLALDLVTGRIGPEHPLHGYLVRHGAREEDLDALRRDAVVPDVVGVNYYPEFTTQAVTADGAESPVEAGTAGLVELLGAYHERYGLPLAITETSRATRDVAAKAQWVDDLLDTVDKVRADGVPVTAVFWFPLLDLMDWSYRDGTAPADEYLMPFGLVDLVRGADNVLARVPNAAYDRWRTRIASAR